MTRDELIKRAEQWHEQGHVDDETLDRVREGSRVSLAEHVATRCNSYERWLLYHLCDPEALAYQMDQHAVNTGAAFQRGCYPLEWDVGDHYDQSLALVLVPLAAAWLRTLAPLLVALEESLGVSLPAGPLQSAVHCKVPSCGHRWIPSPAEVAIGGEAVDLCGFHRHDQDDLWPSVDGADLVDANARQVIARVVDHLVSECPGGLTHDQIRVALRNIGYAVDCDACMEVFYTGSTDAEHTCDAEVAGA